MTGKLIVAFSIVAGAALAALPEPPNWRPVEEAKLTPTQKAQLERGKKAQGELAGRLMKTLLAKVKADGHAAAIDVCSDAAPKLAADVAKSSGIFIGRTSAKLRNPKNEAPPWVAAAVAAGEAKPQLFLNDRGTVGFAQPIMLGQPCTACHGQPDELAAGVAEQLARRYPKDQATGFKEGDLRGWFWVEVPAAKP